MTRTVPVMSERELLLKEIELTERLLALYSKLRSLPAQEAAPAIAPPPRPQAPTPYEEARSKVPPTARPIAQIPIPMVQGPNGAAAPMVDLSSVAHLIQGPPEHRAQLERNIADMVAALANGKPLQNGELKYYPGAVQPPTPQPVQDDPGGVAVR